MRSTKPFQLAKPGTKYIFYQFIQWDENTATTNILHSASLKYLLKIYVSKLESEYNTQ